MHHGYAAHDHKTPLSNLKLLGHKKNPTSIAPQIQMLSFTQPKTVMLQTRDKRVM